MRAIAGAILILAAVQALIGADFWRHYYVETVLRMGPNGQMFVLGWIGIALFIVGVCFLFMKDKPKP